MSARKALRGHLNFSQILARRLSNAQHSDDTRGLELGDVGDIDTLPVSG